MATVARERKIAEIGRTVRAFHAYAEAGAQVGAPVGGVTGAVLGVVVPVVGNLVGGIVGFALGAVVGAICGVCIGALSGKLRGALGGGVGVLYAVGVTVLGVSIAGERLSPVVALVPLLVFGAIGTVVGDSTADKLDDRSSLKSAPLNKLRDRLDRLKVDEISSGLRIAVALTILYIPVELLLTLVRTISR